MTEGRDYSTVDWPWDDDPNWDQPREGATYDREDQENWRLGCSECGLHFPTELELHVVGDHWQGHFPGFSADHQEPGIELNLIWVGLGTPPTGGQT